MNYFIHYLKIISLNFFLNYVYNRLRNLIANMIMITFTILETFICLNSIMKLREFDIKYYKFIQLFFNFNFLKNKYMNNKNK